ncbi:leucyl aminopeptidase family protein [Aliikangiella marina]|uniref:Leucyl aminopeptidase family protein n=1 Tax=Aliikangiella marina TaxID=1712262 RepID=A0A545T156_9GAMM|nr:leucyl aminopeptidase family protein [Aliikangiella marina]TQV70948.1 leucyl aminopeptidase family protein [Aliikangiella marina]
MAYPRLILTKDPQSLLAENSNNDAVILVTPTTTCETSPIVNGVLEAVAGVDKRLGAEVMLIHAPSLCGGRLIHCATGPIDRDYDDVRNFGDAAAKGIELAKESGAKNPLLLVEGVPGHEAFQRATSVAYLSICQKLWQPLEAREALNESEIEPIETIGLLDIRSEVNAEFLDAVESGRRLARDLCGTNPERFAPPAFADYCVEAFEDSGLEVSVIDDQDEIVDKFPLLAAVARSSRQVPRHQARVINLEYTGEGPIEKTLILIGKGVTFDTGGADLKVGGHMAGMSRDKGGAAAVAGFMKTVAMCQPKGLKVIATLGMVRNSIGAECFVADEIIQAHSGVRVRIGNTDAEGRLVMADLLSHGREKAKSAVAPELMTVATLTGHAALAAGPYTIMIENGPARDQQVANKLEAAGEAWGDGVEVGRSRREDWHIIRPRTKADDVLSSNNGPSVSVARGHQFPMAFLALAAGLDKHGSQSEQPLAYTHIDIAGSGIENSDWQHGKPTGSPLIAMAARYLSE